MKTPVEHYKTMISWVRKRDPQDFVDPGEMELAIGENWTSQYCAYCANQIGCNNCPMEKVPGEEQCNGVWVQMNESRTWWAWLLHATELLGILIELEKGKNHLDFLKANSI